MKHIKIIIFLYLITLTICPKVYGDSIILDNYNQVTNIGGTTKTDEIIVSKIISEKNYAQEKQNLENYFDITLKVQTKEKADDLALDVVIVLDISNTMNEKMSDGKTRLKAAQEASINFIKEFAQRANQNTNVERKIGFAVFNTDAKIIFPLQICNNDTCLENLSKLIVEQTNAIAQSENYAKSVKRFTNIEAGLKLASDMLTKSKPTSKHIIFISDGFPTTYIKENYNGYNPYMDNSNEFFVNYLKNNKTINYDDDGIFYDKISNKLCEIGTSYSDKAAIKAKEIAKKIKSEGINIYTIGVDIGGQTIQKFLDLTNSNHYVVDRRDENYEIGDSSNSSAYKNWLKNTIGSGYYEDVETSKQFKDNFDKIFKQIIELSEASWIVQDPMNTSNEQKNIEFIGIYDTNKKLTNSVKQTNNQGNTAYYDETDKIKWNLKKSIPIIEKNNNETYYTYELNYRIRLQNESVTFKETDNNQLKTYKTNGETILNYIIKKNNKIENKTISLKIPEIIGYLSELEFTKVSKIDNEIKLEGAEFELKHSPNCPCYNELKHPDKLIYKETSNKDGKVKFNNIPSGHKYTLTEINPPKNHILDEKTYDIDVSYDKVEHQIKENIIQNDYLKSNLKIKKTVEGPSNAGVFNFNLNLTYNAKPVTGNFKINNTDENITFDKNGNAKIYLKNNETIQIENLPYEANYKITELNTEGYQVKYKINNILKQGATIENKLNSYKETINIEFINTSTYLMPETGSFKMIILVITGVTLITCPVIYICYEHKKKGKI